MTFVLRFRTPSRGGAGALAVLRDSSRAVLFSLNLEQVEGSPQLQFLLRTDTSDVPLRLAAPIALIGSARWHTVVARYAGPKIDYSWTAFCWMKSGPWACSVRKAVSSSRLAPPLTPERSVWLRFGSANFPMLKWCLSVRVLGDCVKDQGVSGGAFQPAPILEAAGMEYQRRGCDADV